MSQAGEGRGKTGPAAEGETAYQAARGSLRAEPRRWVVTGAAGFIGSHLVEHLLQLGQAVVGVDNLSTGRLENLEEVMRSVGEASRGFRFVEGDIRDLATCREACDGAEVVLHQAALGSVPRSIDDPIATNASNVDGTLNVLVAARDAGVKRFVYAASSSTYGDSPELPKVEERIGRPLSPYAVSKYVAELYADVFQRVYGLEVIGLRYFNVFGPRQDPAGAYAAVIPRWIGSLLAGEPCRIHGDGETSRDFTYVENVVQANLLAATAAGEGVTQQVYNAAAGGRTTLNELHAHIVRLLRARQPELAGLEPIHGDFRPGDVRHSQASIEKIREKLGYLPAHSLESGLRLTVEWFSARGPREEVARATSASAGADEIPMFRPRIPSHD